MAIEATRPIIDSFAKLFSIYKARPQKSLKGTTSFHAGDFFCPTCFGPRQVSLRCMCMSPLGQDERAAGKGVTPQWFLPALHLMECLQCATPFTAVTLQVEDQYELIICPGVHGGSSTPNTPPGVKYYLDQAHRADAVGASSAAMAMYRSAVEQVLFEQGFKSRMLRPKLLELSRAVDDRTAPEWALRLDPDYMRILNRLGNGALHPNDGNYTRQKVIDASLLSAVKMTLRQILDVVYEQPARNAIEKTELTAAVAKLEGIDVEAARAEQPQ